MSPRPPCSPGAPLSSSLETQGRLAWLRRLLAPTFDRACLTPRQVRDDRCAMATGQLRFRFWQRVTAATSNAVAVDVAGSTLRSMACELWDGETCWVSRMKTGSLRSVWLHELRWPEVKAYLETSDVALVPIGATEQRGCSIFRSRW